MIRAFKNSDLTRVMQIWLDSNTQTHSFIPKEYWEDNFDFVKEAIEQSELYVYENDKTKLIDGFVGITDEYIEGIFVSENTRSKGIGKELLNYVKNVKQSLTLGVYQKNERAVKFYLRENFEIQNQKVDENTGEKEYIMTWKNG